MKKSVFAMLCVLFGLLAVPLAYAEDATDDAAAQEEALPPLIDPAVDSGS